MRLLVDVGNSRVKWQLVEESQVRQRGALQHEGRKDPVSWGEQLWSTLVRPNQVVIANVTGRDVDQALDAWITQRWALKAQFVVSEQRNYGITNGYDVPHKLGVDRWVAMIGARTITQHGCVVIDCGTAVTLDALTATGEHLGGVILPGVRLMHAALFRNTQLFEEEPGEITVFGRSTRDCIWGGTVHTLAAAIDRMSDTMIGHELSTESTRRLLTGGNAESLMPYLQHAYQHQPDLIFEGLRLISEQGKDTGHDDR